MNSYKILCEAFDQQKIDEVNARNKENRKLGIAGAALTGVGALGSMAAYNDAYRDSYSYDPNVNLMTGVAATAATGMGLGSLALRSKRQKLVFEKVMQRFPSAKDMCAFLDSQNLHPTSLTPDTPDENYAIWVQRNIVKKGRFWNVMLQFLFGFGGAGLIYHGAKLYHNKNIAPEEMVTSNLGTKPKYNSVQKA